MSDPTIQKLIEILRTRFPEYIAAEIDLKSEIKDLGIDSLDFVELIYEVETNFDIELPAEDLEKISTLESLVEIIDLNQTKEN